MTTDLIERLAREAGAAKFYPERQAVKEDAYLVGRGFLEGFARLVAEECAKVCEDASDEYQRSEGRRFPELKTDAEAGADHCAHAIRAKFGEGKD